MNHFIQILKSTTFNELMSTNSNYFMQNEQCHLPERGAEAHFIGNLAECRIEARGVAYFGE